MKRNYITAEIEFVSFHNADIITNSGDITQGNGDLPSKSWGEIGISDLEIG